MARHRSATTSVTWTRRRLCAVVRATVDVPAPAARPEPGDAWTVPAHAAYPLLDSSPRGLTETQARQRLERDGPNALPAPRRTSLLLRFAGQFTDVFAILLLVAAGITVL